LIEQQHVLADVASVEPLLLRTADPVIYTTIPLSTVVNHILAAADGAVAGTKAATGNGPSWTWP
jgi:hypothetical protein